LVISLGNERKRLGKEQDSERNIFQGPKLWVEITKKS